MSLLLQNFNSAYILDLDLKVSNKSSVNLYAVPSFFVGDLGSDYFSNVFSTFNTWEEVYCLMCILVYSTIIAEQQRVCLWKCCANVVLNLSPWETDDENTRAMLPRCSTGFVIDVEQLPSQFNSAQPSSILCYLLFLLM